MKKAIVCVLMFLLASFIDDAFAAGPNKDLLYKIMVKKSPRINYMTSNGCFKGDGNYLFCDACIVFVGINPVGFYGDYDGTIYSRVYRFYIKKSVETSLGWKFIDIQHSTPNVKKYAIFRYKSKFRPGNNPKISQQRAEYMPIIRGNTKLVKKFETAKQYCRGVYP